MKLSDLKVYFETAKLPPNEIKLNNYTTITDVKKFIDSHIAILEANPGNRSFLPFYTRLLNLYTILTQTK